MFYSMNFVASEVYVIRNALKRYARHGFGEAWEKKSAFKLLADLPQIEVGIAFDDVVIGSKRKGKKAMTKYVKK